MGFSSVGARVTEVAARLPGRPINGQNAGNQVAGRSGGRNQPRQPVPVAPLPRASGTNDAQVIDALSQRVADLEARLAALESVLEVSAGGGSVTLVAAGSITLSASTITLSASGVTLDAAMTSTGGVISCDTIIAQSVVGSSYTPGAGNVW
ncbi:hypothetical protein [Roseospira navarrensis]|uniref:Uncharacterized protein n=1 Tax=Roseospira navarrensis TaxID=140058 RepID=A0A7X1ZFM0_9PROT|nr:hypothetical protein [Roseospira navarrensis]MQX37670.1 hypothetical protein [Roseospira navarrensis]